MVLSSFRTWYQLFAIVKAVHYQIIVHAMTSLYKWLCSKTVKTWEVVLCSVIEHGMTPFLLQIAQYRTELRFVLLYYRSLRTQ